MSLQNDLFRYMDAGFPILYVNSFEEAKAEQTVKRIADRMTVGVWSKARGYIEERTESGIGQVSLEDLNQVLNIKLSGKNDLNRFVLVIKDAHTVLEDANTVALLKEVALRISEGTDCCIVLVSPVVTIPVELEKYITLLESDYQGPGEICRVIDRFVADNGAEVSDRLREEMITSFKGLSEFEIRNILALAVASSGGKLTRKSLDLIFEQKRQMILKSGTLEMIPRKEKMEDIGGLEELKQWLERKAKVVKNMNQAAEYGVDMPKGVLIAGVPGCGKSLCAKAAADLFEVPLLRLDVGKLMGKYLGESEANLRRAIQLAEAISPCVLWVDELEKAFAGIEGNGHETTIRLFGSFLTWMQEKTSATFVVATANDIMKLPPELLRKGRFDEIFFVDLPKTKERENIFKIHIKKRRARDLEHIDAAALANETKGYSGADIEGVIKDGIEYAFCSGESALSTDDIRRAIKETSPLEEVMKESIGKMREEYKKRKFKPASKKEGVW